jgi:hypothetical protein
MLLRTCTHSRKPFVLHQLVRCVYVQQEPFDGPQHLIDSYIGRMNHLVEEMMYRPEWRWDDRDEVSSSTKYTIHLHAYI